MKIGIVVPFSWSYWGGVIEHAEHQAQALIDRGHDVRVVCGHDPPGNLTRVLHPRLGRHTRPPAWVTPVGRSVVVPANGSLPNIVLSPQAVPRMRALLERERFDVLHLHEPMTPALCVAALALARCPVVATWHASGKLGWMKGGVHIWGFLMERIDARIAVSDQARTTAERWLPGDYEVIPNGVFVPEDAAPAGREHRIAFIGRHDRRKGLAVLLQAWPELRRRTGARLRLMGADPLQVRLALTRLRVPDDGIDVLGVVTNEVRTSELETAKLLVSPALGGESFGLVLAEAFACATPVVASDISGYRDVMTPETGLLVPPDDSAALVDAVEGMLADEPRRVAMGAAARELAVEQYSWPDVARRLEQVYERVAQTERAEAAA
jgi:phosphatidyl-myo-inositol alpha-mannosyltransferase